MIRSIGAIEQLRSIVRRFTDTPSAVPGGCPLMNTAIDADDGNPVLRDLVRKAFADWRNRLAAVVQEGIDSGEIKAKIAPRRVANTIIATLEGALMLSRLEKNHLALRDPAPSTCFWRNSKQARQATHNRNEISQPGKRLKGCFAQAGTCLLCMNAAPRGMGTTRMPLRGRSVILGWGTMVCPGTSASRQRRAMVASASTASIHAKDSPIHCLPPPPKGK